MYIPFWAIIIGVILIAFLASRTKRQIDKNRFAYKLEVNVTPIWWKILQHQYPKLSEKDLEKFIDDSKKKASDNSLFQTVFPTYIEFYDNVSGMCIRWMEKWESGKNSWRGYCDEFEINGNIFDFENVYPDKQDERLRVKVSIDGITTFKKNKNYVGIGDNLFEEDKILSYIPLEELKEFFIELGNRFHDIEMKPVIKWPEKFQKIFKEHNIKHFRWDNWYNDESTLFDIEKHDKKFFEKWGEPKVALFGDNQSHRFETKYADYDIRIKLFRPEI